MSQATAPAAKVGQASIAAQAAEWLTRLDEASEAERRAFIAWQQADPRHAAAVQAMQGMIDQLQGLREQRDPAHAALDASLNLNRKPHSLRKHASTLALGLLALALPGWLALQHFPIDYLLADINSGTAQWKTQTLADQSRITLNSNSAVDVDFDASQRVLTLLQGEVLVDVAKDASRPFIVKTAHGSVTALGTRFIVSRQAEVTQLSMLESRVKAMPASASAPAVVSEGQGIAIQRNELGPVHAIDAASLEDAWRLHQLVVQDRPLPEVLAALSRHTRGHISFDQASLQHLRVTAVLPLDDSQQALQLLANSLPVRIRSYSPWWVMVDARP